MKIQNSTWLATIAFTGALTFTSSISLGWGGRGHHAICDAAVFLVKNEGLKDYLRNKPQIMGHLCNIPDTYWRSIPQEQQKLGNPTHYINPETLGLKISEVPDDFEKIITTYTGQDNKSKENKKIFSIPDDLGSNWWRAEQFYRRAVADGKNILSFPAPKDSRDEQNDDLPYNKAFFDMVVNMGIMGHFIGDAAQPYHNTTDYDGWASNSGGIHGYYEDQCVAYFDADLVPRIVKKAKTLKKTPWLQKKNFIEKMKALSDLSVNDVKAIQKLDPITKPSSIRIEKGMSIKTPAERKSAQEGFKRFEKLILEQLARASHMLAHSWDLAYEEAGKPQLKAYKSYKYPHQPEFVPPDYYKAEAIKK